MKIEFRIVSDLLVEECIHKLIFYAQQIEKVAQDNDLSLKLEADTSKEGVKGTILITGEITSIEGFLAKQNVKRMIDDFKHGLEPYGYTPMCENNPSKTSQAHSITTLNR